MRHNLTGGPSIIFHGKQVKDETQIRNNPDQIVKSVVGYDANALYLWCTAQSMPMGRPRVFRLNEENKLKQVFDPDVSGKQNLWLGEIEKTSPDLRYAIKNGEKCVGPRKRKVDGYSETTNTAFEFDGCYYHGCSCVKRTGLTDPAEIDAFNKLMAERRKSTEKKHNYLPISVISL